MTSLVAASAGVPAVRRDSVASRPALLKDDHKSVESLFKQFEKAGDRAVKAKRQLADQMIKELTTHACIGAALARPLTGLPRGRPSTRSAIIGISIQASRPG